MVGMPDLAEVARQYHQLDGEQRAELLHEGALAAVAHRIDPTKNAFGLRPQDVETYLNHQVQNAEMASLSAEKSDCARNFKMASMVSDRFQFESLGAALSAARMQSRLLGKSRATVVREREVALRQFGADGRQEVAQSLCAALSMPAQQLPVLKSFPCQQLAGFEVVSTAASVAKDVVSWTFERSELVGRNSTAKTPAASAASGLDALWLAHHTVLEHAKAPPLGKLPTSRGPRCWEAGFCVCNKQGVLLAKFRSQLLKTLSFLFPASKPTLRSQLTSRNIFVKLISCNPDDVAENEGASYHFGPNEVAVVMHLGAMYLSPFRPTWHIMHVEATEPDSGVLDLKATGSFLTLWRWVQHVSVDKWWALQAFTLLERPRPIVTFLPMYVSVQPLVGPSAQCVTFWNPKKGVRASRRHANLLEHVDMIVDGADPEEPPLDEGSPNVEERKHDEHEEDVLDFACGDEPEEQELGGTETPIAGEYMGSEDEGPPLAHAMPSEVPDAREGEGGAGNNGIEGVDSAVESEGPARRHGERVAALCVATLVGYGKISYYPAGQYFEAVCCNPMHGKRCVLKRMNKAHGTRLWQGRPLGFLTAWLVEGPQINAKHDHTVFKPTYDQRSIARLIFSMDDPSFAELGTHERKLRDNEFDEEPDHFE
jgi:hypothetical protein